MYCLSYTGSKGSLSQRTQGPLNGVPTLHTLTHPFSQFRLFSSANSRLVYGCGRKPLKHVTEHVNSTGSKRKLNPKPETCKANVLTTKQVCLLHLLPVDINATHILLHIPHAKQYFPVNFLSSKKCRNSTCLESSSDLMYSFYCKIP